MLFRIHGIAGELFLPTGRKKNIQFYYFQGMMFVWLKRRGQKRNWILLRNLPL